MPSTSTPSPQTEPQPAGRRAPAVSWPWLAVLVLMVCFVWGNSLVPGEGSGNLSLEVTHLIQGVLSTVGLPYEWVTNFLVRKAAHFTEYMVLGIVAMQAFRPHRSSSAARLLATALFLVLIPSLDETIQLFVSGRAGQVTDVLIDCSGALTGVLLTLLASFIWRRAHNKRQPNADSATGSH